MAVPVRCWRGLGCAGTKERLADAEEANDIGYESKEQQDTNSAEESADRAPRGRPGDPRYVRLRQCLSERQRAQPEGEQTPNQVEHEVLPDDCAREVDPGHRCAPPQLERRECREEKDCDEEGDTETLGT